MRPTMDDVAQAAGVSRSLVSLVFQDSPKVAPPSRARVLEAAARLGYRPNALARSLASRQVRTFGVLLNDLSNPFFAEVYESIAAAAEVHGYDLLLGAGQRSPGHEEGVVASFLAHRVSGLILVSPRMSAPSIRELTQGLPTVVIGREVRLPHADAITSNDEAGVRSALEHLVALGHRDIAHISGGSGAGARDRRAAYQNAMSALGLAASIRIVEADFTERAGAEALRTLLELPSLPTALLAANDMVAVGAMGALAAAGMRVPDDMSVVGYDNLALADLAMISLTSVEQPLAEFGRAATDLLIERLDGGRTRRIHRSFEPTLVVRGSTAAPGA